MPFPLLAAAGAAAAGAAGAWGANKLLNKTENVYNNARSGVANQRTGNALTGYNAYNQQLPRLSPEQIQQVNRLLPGVAQQLQGNQFDFAPIEEKSRQDFERYSAPSLAARFASFGGGTSTDAYRDAMARAHGEHETGLAALKSQYALQQRGQLQNLFGTLLSPTYENIYTPATSGFAGGIAEGAAPALGKLGVDAISDWYANRPSKVGTQADTGGTATNKIGGAATTAPANRDQMAKISAILQYLQNRKGA